MEQNNYPSTYIVFMSMILHSDRFYVQSVLKVPRKVTVDPSRLTEEGPAKFESPKQLTFSSIPQVNWFDDFQIKAGPSSIRLDGSTVTLRGTFKTDCTFIFFRC